MSDHRAYLDEQYRLAVLDFQTAHSEDEQWSARKRMADVERTASENHHRIPIYTSRSLSRSARSVPCPS